MFFADVARESDRESDRETSLFPTKRAHKTQTQTNRIMTAQREYIFCNDTAYNITSTMAYVENLYRNERTIVEWRYESIMSQLSSFKFEPSGMADFVEHCYNGVFTPIDLWLREFGIEEDIGHWIGSSDTVTTFPVDCESVYGGSEDAIESEDEEEMCIGHQVIMEMIAEDRLELGLAPDNDGIVTDDWGVSSHDSDYDTE